MTPDEIREARELVGMEGWGQDGSAAGGYWLTIDAILVPSGRGWRPMSMRSDGRLALGLATTHDGAIPDTDYLPTRYALLGIVRRVEGWGEACVHGEVQGLWLLGYTDDERIGADLLFKSIAEGPTESLALIRAAKRALEVMTGGYTLDDVRRAKTWPPDDPASHA